MGARSFWKRSWRQKRRIKRANRDGRLRCSLRGFLLCMLAVFFLQSFFAASSVVLIIDAYSMHESYLHVFWRLRRRPLAPFVLFSKHTVHAHVEHAICALPNAPVEVCHGLQ